MRKGTGAVWTAEEDQAFQEMLARSMSFREVAAVLSARFGAKRTRDACIARANRRGWKSRLTRADSNRGGRMVRAKAATPRPLKIAPRRPIEPPAPSVRAQLIELRSAPVEPLHLSLAELKLGNCRYPFGDGPFTFCGHQAIPGGPYCGPHAALTLDPDQRFDRRKRMARCFAEAAE